MEGEESRSKILVVVGIFVLTLALFVLSITYTATTVARWIVIVIVILIFLYMTRKIWKQMTFQKFKIYAIVGILLGVAYVLLKILGYSISIIVSDPTPISPSLVIIFFIWLGAWMTKGMKKPQESGDLMRALFIFIFSNAYVVLGEVFGKVSSLLWFEVVCGGAISLWITNIGLKNSILYHQMRKYTPKKGWKWYFKESLWLLITSISPFIFPAVFLAEETKNWWEVGSVLFSYGSLFFLFWVLWLEEKFKYFLDSQKN